MNITTRTIAATAAAAAVVALASAPVAASAAAAPSCLKVSIDDNKRSDTVTVSNTCKTPYAVKVVWAYETDSQCEYLGARIDHFDSTRDFPARFDGLKLC